MRFLARLALVGLLGLPGCEEGEFGATGPAFDGDADIDVDGDGDTEQCDRSGAGPLQAGYTLEVDTSALDPFVTGAPPTYPIAGTVRSSKGIGRVEVNGAPATVEGESFSADMPLVAGLVKVPITAVDQAGNQRVGNRSLLSARFLPEGDVNPGAAAMVLDDDILAAMIAPYVEEVADIDLAEQIMDQAGGLNSNGCDVSLNRVTTGQASIRMFVGQGGALTFTFTVPDIDVSFSGECSSFIGSATFQGRLRTDVVVTTTISVPYTGACAENIEHTYPEVDLPNYNLDLDIQMGGGGLFGGGGGLMDLMMPIIEEIMKGVVKGQMQTQIAEQADGIINEQANQFGNFDSSNAFSFANTQINVGFCLTGLGPENGLLRARVGLSAQGPGGRQAPGAPQVEGELPAAQPTSLWFDANLIGQFMFSLWTSGAFQQEVEGMVNVGTLALVAPEIGEHFCDDTPITIRIDGLIPPIVRAAAPDQGDMVVELGDLMIDLVAEGQLLLGIGASVRITLDLVPENGALKPTVTNVEVDSHIRAEPVADLPDELILGIINDQFDSQVEGLLGDGGFELPELGGLVLNPTDVVAEPGGRYMRITLAP